MKDSKLVYVINYSMQIIVCGNSFVSLVIVFPAPDYGKHLQRCELKLFQKT